MRKNYVKPALISEELIPQTYVAACSEEPGYTKYSFICNAGLGVTHDKNGLWPGGETKYVWEVRTNDGQVLANNDKGLYGPCGSDHTVTVPAGTSPEKVFLIGTMDNYYTENVNENIPVYIWRGDNNDNVHCMTNPGTEHIAVPKQMS